MSRPSVPYASNTGRAPQAPRWAHAQASAPTSCSVQIHPPSQYVAVSSQYVYVGQNKDIQMVARVSITDYRGNVLMDTFIRPTEKVTDYRSNRTGLHPDHLKAAPPFSQVQAQVAGTIRGKIIVGYSLWEFLSVLGLHHPAIDTRDVSLFMPFRKTLRCRNVVPLATLVNQLMGRNISSTPGMYEHPLEYARAALDLFRSSQEIWENAIASGSWPCALPPSDWATCFT